MLPNELPEIIDPVKLCRQNGGAGAVLSGIISVNRLSSREVYSSLISQQPIAVELDFSHDLNKINLVTGHISSVLRLNCQRCLEDFDFTLSQKIYVGVVTSQKAAEALPSEYEPLLVEGGKVNLLDWISEEINLSIPMIPKHSEPCGLQQNFSDTNNNIEKEEKKENSNKIFPFADLNKKLN
tara:strand:- start:234610 stop:235155 length:546 start_codon:yes stop_codon:yes gene_type:complete